MKRNNTGGHKKRCRLSWLTNSALVYETKCGGGRVAGSQPVSTAVCAYGAQINFGDLTSYLTYDKTCVHKGKSFLLFDLTHCTCHVSLYLRKIFPNFFLLQNLHVRVIYSNCGYTSLNLACFYFSKKSCLPCLIKKPFTSIS